MHGYETYKVLTSLFNEETNETYPLYIHKIEILKAYHQNCIYFDKSEGQFISMPKQNTMKMYRKPGHKHAYILTSAFSCNSAVYVLILTD